jgi:phage tail sheath protein FI
MPAVLNYPGVYIDEVSSGVRTITGVATSITAFIGRALRGPVNEPTMVRNFGEFERLFGGLAADHTVAYAVQDFFGNGGAQAHIVRLYKPPFATDAARTAALGNATTAAQTAANLVSTAAGTAAAAAGATPASVAQAASDEVVAASVPGPIAAQAAQLVAAAARAEAGRAPYMTTSQRIAISGGPTAGAIKLAFKNDSTADITFSTLTGGSSEGDLKNDLEGLPAIGAGNIASVTRSGGPTPDFTFLITFGGTLAGPQPLIVASHTLTGGTSPTVTVSLPLPDAASVATAATNAVPTATGTAAGAAAPVSRARFTFPGALEIEAASPGVWGNFLHIKVDYDTRPLLDNSVDPTLYNLTVTDKRTARSERIRNVSSVSTSARLIGRVLMNESSLIRVVSGSTPTGRPPVGEIDVAPTGQAVDSLPLLAAEFNGDPNLKTGLFALDKADLFNLLCIPPDTRDGDTSMAVYQTALTYCVNRRAMLIVDSPAAWSANPDTAAAAAVAGLPSLGLNGVAARNAALFFPRIDESDPMQEGQVDTFVPCGAVAGIFARTDSSRGVWKAPAGLDAAINGIVGLHVNLNDGENGSLNPLGINNLRSFPVSGQVVWGARTLRGADSIGDEYKYIPVRRMALFLEETLYRATQWVVFEPNDEPLWAQIRLNIGAFLQTLFRQGAFQGRTPKEAYFVKCDRETTTQADINLGIVNILVGFAPLKPAEFVVIKLQQIAGDIPT